MKQSYWLALPFILSLVSCQASKPLSPNAANCAAVVQNYLGITDPVSVAKSVEQPASQQVDIEYQSQDDENLPINGIASCVFAAPDAQSDRLLSATVNNQPLTPENITALNQKIKFSQ